MLLLLIIIKEPLMLKWFVVYAFSFFIFQWIAQGLFQKQENYYLVIDQRSTWAIVHNGIKSFYIEIPENLDIHVGDILWIHGSLRPISMTTYEGLFQFPDYLKSMGVSQQIESNSLTPLFRFPLRIDPWLNGRLTKLNPDVANFISQLLWRRKIEQTTTLEGITELIHYSGFGFYMTNQWMDAVIKIKWSYRQSLIFRIIFFLPYILINFRQFGMVRVYFIELLKWIMPSLNIKLTRVIVISVQSWLNPFLWLQEGMYMYLMYQGWIRLVLPLFPKLKGWMRWLSFICLGLGYTWFKEGVIFSFSRLWFVPISLFNGIIIPFWILYFYIGLPMPILTWITEKWLGQIETIGKYEFVLIGGTVPFWMQSLFITHIVMFGVISWLKLKHYQPSIIITFLMTFILQFSGLENHYQTFVHMINVGQGDATLVHSNGETMLIDTGGVKHFDIAEDVLIPYFRKLKIIKLDYVVITHSDFDHDGGLLSLLSLFRVDEVIKEPFNTIKVGDLLVKNYQQFHENLKEDNERSLVLGIQQRDCQWLIMGDATFETEILIQNYYPNLTANILRIGHHGSNTSTSTSWLNQIRPKEVVISVGGGNRYGHPHHDVLNRITSLNIPIRRTDNEGTIRYQTCKI